MRPLSGTVRRIRRKETSGGLIREIIPGSQAEAAGLRPGDILEAVNGRELCDVIDYKFHTTETRCRLTINRSGETFLADVCKEPDSDLGIRFEDDFFDGLRTCRANCIFCFVDQHPPGVRAALKVKDDDYRLSFLHGDYISLSNLTDRDFARIAEQRLSPLYVSVHTTNPDLRRRMMRGPAVGDIMEQLRRLLEARIEIHAQVVVCPGYNDGSELDRTISDLGVLFPDLRSVSVVPVGLTRHRNELPEIHPLGPEMAREILRQVHSWQRRLREKIGTRFVFAGDEMYLSTGVRLPSLAAYEGFPQLDNGVGEARLMLADLAMAERTFAEAREGLTGTFVTGLMCAPIIQAFATRVNAARGSTLGVLAVENRFFGLSVTTAGLLAGRDIIEQAKAPKVGVAGPLYVARRSLRDDLFIDDVPVGDLEAGLRMRVIPLDSPAEVLAC